MTTTETLSIVGEPREMLGSSVKALRRAGITPANLYGRGAESISFQAASRELEKLVTDGGRGSLVELTIGGETYHTLLRGLQRHPVTRVILHAEFHRVDMNRTIQTPVPLHIIGDPPASRLPGAVVTQMTHEVLIECLPANIPAAIEVDVSGLVELETAIHVSDIVVPEGVQILTEGEQMIVRATHSRVSAALDDETTEAEVEAPEVED